MRAAKDSRKYTVRVCLKSTRLSTFLCIFSRIHSCVSRSILSLWHAGLLLRLCTEQACVEIVLPDVKGAPRPAYTPLNFERFAAWGKRWQPWTACNADGQHYNTAANLFQMQHFRLTLVFSEAEWHGQWPGTKTSAQGKSWSSETGHWPVYAQCTC